MTLVNLFVITVPSISIVGILNENAGFETKHYNIRNATQQSITIHDNLWSHVRSCHSWDYDLPIEESTTSACGRARRRLTREKVKFQIISNHQIARSKLSKLVVAFLAFDAGVWTFCMYFWMLTSLRARFFSCLLFVISAVGKEQRICEALASIPPIQHAEHIA